LRSKIAKSRLAFIEGNGFTAPDPNLGLVGGRVNGMNLLRPVHPVGLDLPAASILRALIGQGHAAQLGDPLRGAIGRSTDRWRGSRMWK
jgi:hypothetical protein